MYKIFTYGLLVTLFFSCGDSQSEVDEILIMEYIEDNNLDTQSTSSGLHYLINEAGSAEKPNLNSEVEVCYEGYFLTGQVFETLYQNGVCSEAVMFPLANVIDGWQEGIQLFGKGGSGTLLIPSHLAYGSAGNGPVGPDTIIAFDIELIDFQ